MDPILHRAWRISQESRHFRAGHALCHQQDAVQAVIVTRFLRALDFLLQAKTAEASEIKIGLMSPGDHVSTCCAITYDAVFSISNVPFDKMTRGSGFNSSSAG